MTTVSYGPHDRQVFKSYIVPSIPSNWMVVFIHGGAWRDPTNTCLDADAMADYMAKMGPERSREANFFSLDYRLTPEAHHPDFLLDVLLAMLNILALLPNKKLLLCGHSVGATLALQYLDALRLVDRSLPINPEKVVLLDGIYNIPLLLEEYPSYSSFVQEAHIGSDYIQATQFSLVLSDYSGQFLVIQSTKDELLSLNQTENLLKWFESQNIVAKLVISDFGAHNDVYINKQVALLIFNQLV